MKTISHFSKTATVALMVIWASSLSAQDFGSQPTVEFDFSTKQFYAPEMIEYGENLLVSVKNINLNKYELTIDSEQFSYTFEKPEIDVPIEPEERTKTEELAEELVAKADSIRNLIGFVTDPLQEAINEFSRIIGEVNEYRTETEAEWLKTQLKLDLKVDEAQAIYLGKLEGYLSGTRQLNVLIQRAESLWLTITRLGKESSYSNISEFEKLLDLAKEKQKSANQLLNDLSKFDKSFFQASKTFDNVTGDEILIKLLVKNKNTDVETGYTYTIKVKGKFKIDWSSGAVFNLGAGDQSYYIKSDSTIGKNNSQNVTPIYPVLLMNFYCTNGKKVQYGGSAGLGLTEEQKATYYLALSTFIGQEQRLVLSAGVSLRPLTTLKTRYEGGGVTVDPGEISSDDLTTNIYQWRSFVGITYNLTRTKN